MGFDIFPAIDLRRGRVVRLQLGDPERQTVFSDDPAATARGWLAAGATWLHVINLDGAFDERGAANWTALEHLAKLPAQIQFGGGLRSIGDVEAVIGLGVHRVVLGTAAIEQPGLVIDCLARFGPERVVIGIDAREGRVRTRGWREATLITPIELAIAVGQMGVRTIIYTDISRDGVLSGVNAEATATLAEQSGLAVIASGGVNSPGDVARLRSLAPAGVAGVVVGRALYEGRVDLAHALAIATGEPTGEPPC